jgi:hypothetical protein
MGLMLIFTGFDNLAPAAWILIEFIKYISHSYHRKIHPNFNTIPFEL